jgi:DNA (cytosine-5)-methyltransferase 1
VAWGPYAAAIARWEHTLGRPAPAPVDTAGRLAPSFVEWLMGLPTGWVTDTPGLPRSAQLKALGNGVVPQQATAALHLLLDRIAEPSDTGTATERTAA